MPHKNECYTPHEWRDRLAKINEAFPYIRPPQFAGSESTLYYLGMEVVLSRKGYVIFEKCEYCGENQGTYPDLMGIKRCNACTGVV